MAVSDRKLLANRQNAKHSTGPKTREGKRRSRFNALKHGLLAQEVVILSGQGSEDAEQFHRLVANLVSHYAPDGPVEQLMVEKFAIAIWRQRRALRAEGGAIQTRFQRVDVRQRQRESDVEDFIERGDGDGLQEGPLGVAYLIENINRMLTELDEPISDEDLADGKHLASEDARWVKQYLGWDLTILFEQPAALRREIVKGLLVEERDKLVALRIALEREEHDALVAKKAALALPSARACDRLIRYEAAIDRQLHRAISRLESSQQQRGKVAARGGSRQRHDVKFNGDDRSQLPG
jgi:hypothetical protein